MPDLLLSTAGPLIKDPDSSAENSVSRAFWPCSLFLISLETTLFFSNPFRIGTAMNTPCRFACQQAFRNSCPLPASNSFHLLPFPHQFRMCSVSYSSLSFRQLDVRQAEFSFPGSLLKEGSSWRTDFIHAPS